MRTLIDGGDIRSVPRKHRLMGVRAEPTSSWVEWCRRWDKAEKDHDFPVLLGLAASGCRLAVHPRSGDVIWSADVYARVSRFLGLADSTGRPPEAFMTGAEALEPGAESSLLMTESRELIAVTARAALSDNVFRHEKRPRFVARLMGDAQVLVDLLKFLRLGFDGDKVLFWNVEAVQGLPVIQRDRMCGFAWEMCRLGFRRQLPRPAQLLADRHQADLLHVLAGLGGGLDWLRRDGEAVVLDDTFDAWDRFARRPAPGTGLMLASLDDAVRKGREEAKVLQEIRGPAKARADDGV